MGSEGAPQSGPMVEIEEVDEGVNGEDCFGKDDQGDDGRDFQRDECVFVRGSFAMLSSGFN